ncbi:TonB-dependent siderophore receptor [Pseudomonas wenzhouensis]|uniref:TonB-dependent siderophore receptor n=1 Tax=Pseudomonas wenzhouensis TaxID=2906062 RepID=UPI001E2CCDB6|nr:TonB-dependent siderophore receptor [Pseudomonas wenzhouensis]UFQ96720.1 TonB-dependent siderophore receptor [Pseudomonas wenzhouensis]
MNFTRSCLGSPCAVLLTLCLLPASQPLAQELQLPSQEVVARPTQEDDGYQARHASSASKSSVELRDEAQSVQVVTPQTLEDFQVKSLDDAMKFVSGITQSNTLAGTQDGFIKRGFGSNADGSILRDGIRSSLSRNFSATTERVEVLKGPASLLYGALEPGGLINVISKKPQYQWGTQLTADSSSFGGGSLAVDVTGPIADSGLAFRLIAERQNEDYWRNFGTKENSLIAPSLSWEGERLRLNIAYEYKEYSTPVDRGTVIINGKPAKVSYNDRFGESWSKAEGIDELLTATAEYQLSDDWSTRLTYGWNNERYDYAEARPDPIGFNATPGALRRRSDGSEHDNQTQYLAWDLIGNANLFSQRHDLLIGADTERVDNFRGDTWRGPAVGGFNIYNPVYGNLAAPSTLSLKDSDRSDELHSRSIYAKDNWHLNDQWILVLGGRYQRFEQLVEQGRGTTYKRPTDRNDTTFLPFGGLVFQLNDQLAFYGNYSRSFAPNASDADTGQAFDPEEGRSYELGVKLDLPQGIGASLALFDIEKENVVVSNNNVSEAAGKVGSRGVELDISGRLSERWELLGSYAYTDTEILDDPANEGNELVNAARNVGSLYLVHHLHLPQELGQWKLGGGARYVGERAGDNANTFWLDSYTVADAFVTWDSQLLGEKTRLQLNVRNLFNERYYPSSGGNLRVAVGEPRELRLSASVEF